MKRPGRVNLGMLSKDYLNRLISRMKDYLHWLISSFKDYLNRLISNFNWWDAKRGKWKMLDERKRKRRRWNKVIKRNEGGHKSIWSCHTYCHCTIAYSYSATVLPFLLFNNPAVVLPSIQITLFFLFVTLWITLPTVLKLIYRTYDGFTAAQQITHYYFC